MRLKVGRWGKVCGGGGILLLHDSAILNARLIEAFKGEKMLWL